MPLNDRHYRESEEDWHKRIWGRADRQRIKEDHADDIRDMEWDDLSYRISCEDRK